MDITTLLPRGLTILEKEKEYLMSKDLIASNSSATGAVMIPFASDIMHEMFNQIVKIKVSLEIKMDDDTTSTSFERKPDPLATRILSYYMIDRGRLRW